MATALQDRLMESRLLSYPKNQNQTHLFRDFSASRPSLSPLASNIKVTDTSQFIPSWWFQPIWNILVKLDDLPRKKTHLKPPPSFRFFHIVDLCHSSCYFAESGWHKSPCSLGDSLIILIIRNPPRLGVDVHSCEIQQNYERLQLSPNSYKGVDKQLPVIKNWICWNEWL